MTLTGYFLDRSGGNYMILFGIAASAYLVALTIIQLLAPKMEPAEDLDQKASWSSVGSLLGFGFIGFILGTFVGWGTGLIAQQSGQGLLTCMLLGAIAGIGLGIVAGNLLQGARTAKAASG